MSNVTYDILWREAIMELLDQLEAENPDDLVLAPKDLAEWSCIYIKYLQIFRKLEAAYDQMLHPQKRRDVKLALEACIGRMLEVRHYLVELNHGLDFVNLDDVLVDLKLAPEVLEVPIPSFFKEDRIQEIEDQQKYLTALIEQFQEDNKQTEDSKEQSLHEEIKRIEEQDILTTTQQVPEPDAKEKETVTNKGMDEDQAAIVIQAALRGMQWRRKIKEEEEKELIFIEMKPKERDSENDPALIESKNLQRRKEIQTSHFEGYKNAIEEVKNKVELMEGQDMREAIQDKINEWFVENRDPVTGDYPDFPQEEGSKSILNPPPKTQEAELADDGTKDQPIVSKTTKTEPTSQFISDLEGSVQNYIVKWQDRDEQHNFKQSFDVELMKEELRPAVFEQVRKQVDSEVIIMLQNLKEMLAFERQSKGKKGGKKGSKSKKKKGKGDKKGKKKKDLTADRTVDSLYSELVSANIVKEVQPYLMEDYLGTFNCLGATLEKAGNIPDPSMAQIRQLLTEYFVLTLGSQYLHSKFVPYLNKTPFVISFLQIRRLPCLKTVLLYGCASTGKTMLAHAIAHSVGANFFDLSPRNTDGKYPSKQVSLLIHMVFKVAKIMAPSIIYIDECEKVFVTDKKKAKEFGGAEAFSRIKKDLLKEIKSLSSEDRVVVVGTSKEPQICVKKDEKAFIGLWDKHIFLPLPDYSSRRVLWSGLFTKFKAPLPHDFDLSTLAHLSSDLPSGAIHEIVKLMLIPERIQSLDNNPVRVEEIVNWLSFFNRVAKEEEDTLQAWTLKLPNRTTASKESNDAVNAAKDRKDRRK